MNDDEYEKIRWHLIETPNLPMLLEDDDRWLKITARQCSGQLYYWRSHINEDFEDLGGHATVLKYKDQLIEEYLQLQARWGEDEFPDDR